MEDILTKEGVSQVLKQENENLTKENFEKNTTLNKLQKEYLQC
jgi:hypothetical protein